MTNKPFAVSKNEIQELSRCAALQGKWGAGESEEMEMFLDSAYIARFEFINESPGYVGDLFVIQPGCLADEIPVTRVIRNRKGELVLES